jgi:hypothetical protein
VCDAAGWKLLGDFDDALMLQYQATFAGGRSVVVTVHLTDEGRVTPAVAVPLELFRGNIESKRVLYDRTFRRVAAHFAAFLGPSSEAGEYPLHGRQLLYCWWRLDDTAVVLVQNEFEQSPFDISLWVFPPLGVIRFPVTDN